MAYPEYVGDDLYLENYLSRPTTLMIDDIAAIQYLYGVNEQYNSTDTVYTLDSFHTGGTYNAKYGDDFIYASIWDAGGNDTFSWADQTTVSSIDLNPGSFSVFGRVTGPDDPLLDDTWLNNGDGILGIGYNVVIENAIGGPNTDIIVGNTADNTLFGGTGSKIKDTLTGGSGSDIFVGQVSSASSDINYADFITDFENGIDKIGIEDGTISGISFSTIVGGAYNGDIQIYDSNADKILFVLDGVNSSLIDVGDFVITNFV